MSRKNSTENPKFIASRPLVGEMRSVIKRSIDLCPEADPEMLMAELFQRFVDDGLIEQADWAEDLVLSMAIAEVDAMWARAEVV
jgi:hypothetical protein